MLNSCILDRTSSSGNNVTENRRIQINYQGTGNYSTFTFDGLGRNVSVTERVNGELNSTKQFVWSGALRCEARNSSGTIISQYFRYGQTLSGTNYYWTLDHLGSVREMTNSSGLLVDQRAYDSYGRATVIQSTISSDFQYSGYYKHAPSDLNMTVTRAYNSHTGRFLSRDLLEEGTGDCLNLYSYVQNDPVRFTDPWGLQQSGVNNGAPGLPGPGNSGLIQADPPGVAPVCLTGHTSTNAGGGNVQTFTWGTSGPPATGTPGTGISGGQKNLNGQIIPPEGMSAGPAGLLPGLKPQDSCPDACSGGKILNPQPNWKNTGSAQ